MNHETVRRYPPLGKGSTGSTQIKNHPVEDVRPTVDSGEGVRRYPPLGKGGAAPAQIKNHPTEVIE